MTGDLVKRFSLKTRTFRSAGFVAALLVILEALGAGEKWG